MLRDWWSRSTAPPPRPGPTPSEMTPRLAEGLAQPSCGSWPGTPPQDLVGIDRCWADARHELGLVEPEEDRAELILLPVLLARWRAGEFDTETLAGQLLRGTWGESASRDLEDLLMLTDGHEPAVGPRRVVLVEERERLLADWARDVRLKTGETDEYPGSPPAS